LKLYWIVACLGALISAPCVAGPECGTLPRFEAGIGPYDFRTVPEGFRKQVESHHFIPEVERLVRGQTGDIGADIDFVLGTMPNHPRALAAMVRLSKKLGTATPKGAKLSVDCYFQRAVAFQPDDWTVRNLWGAYRLGRGDVNGAIEQFQEAIRLFPEDAIAHYNLGLAYFDKKEYDLAVAEARRARELGLDLPGLQNKLERAGKWR
jgi:hypothetical protein